MVGLACSSRWGAGETKSRHGGKVAGMGSSLAASLPIASATEAQLLMLCGGPRSHCNRKGGSLN